MLRSVLHGCVLTLLGVSASAAPPIRNSLPCVSPDGSKIAFISHRDSTDDVYVIGADGKGERRITMAGAQAVRWSGGAALVTGTGADSGRVFVLSIVGGEPRAVASVKGRNPRLSPDGKQAIYLSGPWTSTALMVANADGSNARRIAGGSATAWNGAWSPDGKKVAYTYGDSTRILQVHVANADGTEDRAITHTSADEGSAQMPAWSADGRRLAIQVSQSRSKTAHVWIIDLATGAARKLAGHADGVLDEVPSWFPDGQRIAFQSTRSGAMEIWTMRADGSDLRQITRPLP